MRTAVLRRSARGRLRLGPALAVCAGLSILAACSSAPSAPPAPARNGVAWSANSFDLQRTGENPHETRLGVGNVSRLRLRWHKAAYSYIDTSPVLAPDVRVGRYREDLLFFGTEGGKVYAVNAESGATVWRRQLGAHIGLGSQCYRSPFGVTATPAVDRAGNRLYVVDGDNMVYALDLSSGATLQGWPVALPQARNLRDHAWGALTELGSRLYVTLASDCDDPPYRGALVELATGATPAVEAVFSPEPPGISGGGIWGWGGVAVDPSGADIYLATGNAFAPDEDAGYGNSLVELSSRTLQVIGHNNPSIPAAGGDWDFGSTPVLYKTPGCPLQLAVESKIGALFVYDASSISPSSRPQKLQVASRHRADFIGDVAYSSKSHLLYVSDPSGSPGESATGTSGGSYEHGLIAFRTLPSCRLDATPAWQGPNLGPPSHLPNPMTDPTVANGVVYFGSGQGKTVYALDAATGRLLWDDHLSAANGIYAAPIVVNGWLYVPTWFGMYAFHT
ncbi:MAG: PQQ-binding-like beta-propeller repeat protein [Acidimicrobiales bacterium]